MSATTLSPVTLSAATCQPWCEATAGHPGEPCAGPSHVVPLAHAHEVEVYQWQAPGEAVQVHLSHDGAAGPVMTLGEVARLQNELSAILSAHGVDTCRVA